MQFVSLLHEIKFVRYENKTFEGHGTRRAVIAVV